MPFKSYGFIVALVLWGNFCFTQPILPGKAVIDLYHKANKLFNNSNPTDKTDSMALLLFRQVIDQLKSTTGKSKDSLLFLSYFKTGNLLDSKLRSADARQYYYNALASLNSANSLQDSLFFKVFVYLGSTYYNLNNFDSASYFLNKAELLTYHVSSGEDKARLYNSLGALYYDNGNFNQSKNYFMQALEIIKGKANADTYNIVAVQTNIATSYFQLGQYEKALDLYKKLLNYRLSANYIYMNMGRANSALNKYEDALMCFRKVHAIDIPGVLNEMAYAELKLNKPDSTKYFLDQIQSHAFKNKIIPNQLDIGVNELYRAELLTSQHNYSSALVCLQKAILIFSTNFKNPDVFSNPATFTGAFAYYKLFEALFKKATVLEAYYRINGREDYLKASYNTYFTTLNLLDYIEKSYDTDDAKLLLKKKSREVFQRSLIVCLELYHLNPKGNYLDQAFLISERNKGSVMAASLKNGLNHNAVASGEKLFASERNIKFNIARLNVKINQTQNGTELTSFAIQKSGYEIELAQLQRKSELSSNYYKLKYNDSYPRVGELQKHLGKKQALISFYITDETLHVFIISETTFKYVSIGSFFKVQQDIIDWINLLKNVENGRKFNGASIGSRLYNNLIKPIQKVIDQKDEWIIIPDGILYFLPFESLPSINSTDKEESLLETTAISYQFSSRFIIYPAGNYDTCSKYDVLGFAPFFHQGISFDSVAGNTGMRKLPSSGEEIAGLKGMSFVDSLATRERFIKEINNYPIIHLATHAVVDINNAAGSYIAFYPHHKSPIEDRLYMEELYGLTMDKTKLVIISACETGKGELVNNEGVISLARAFAYAGCESSVNSLWEADDKATSVILRQFHIYLQKGYSKSKALQQAKLDYIKNNDLSDNPGYWANLILTGNSDPICKPPYPNSKALLSFLIFLFILMALGIKKWKKKPAGKQL
jgi:CHAT domain-containing protein